MSFCAARCKCVCSWVCQSTCEYLCVQCRSIKCVSGLTLNEPMCQRECALIKHLQGVSVNVRYTPLHRTGVGL